MFEKLSCKISILCGLVLFSIFTNSFKLLGQEYVMPIGLSGKPLLSANMGEIRSNTLHAGIDIKTDGVDGKTLYAAMDGYIARIGIKPYGYGKVLYIAHTNGTTTVYAHMNRFAPEIEEYVQKQRYANKQNSVDLYLTSNVFPVTKGQIVGYSGNTGRSYGPHLHYELRETSSQKLLNPIIKGLVEVEDTIAPQILKLYYFEVDTLLTVPIHILKHTITPVNNGNNNYSIPAQKLSGPGYFAVEVTERKNNSHNSLGVYRLTEKVDGNTIIEIAMDSFTFDQATYIPSMVVYSLNKRTKNDVWRLAKVCDTALPFYRRVINKGVINPKDVNEVTIEVADESNNVSTLSFRIEYTDSESSPNLTVFPETAEPVNCKKSYSRNVDGLSVVIPANALFENSLINIYKTTLSVSGAKVTTSRPVLSDIYIIHDSNTPLHKAMTISISAIIAESLRNKLVLARVGTSGELVFAGVAKYENGKITGINKTFGTYCVSADTTPPTVNASFSDGADMSKASSISFTIADDFSGIGSYSATVDGNWVILEHDTIKGKLTHYFDDNLCGRNKNHEIVLKVSDSVGNVTIYRGIYKR